MSLNYRQLRARNHKSYHTEISSQAGAMGKSASFDLKASNSPIRSRVLKYSRLATGH